MFTPVPPKEKCIYTARFNTGEISEKFAVYLKLIKEDQESVPWYVEFLLYRVYENEKQLISTALLSSLEDLQSQEPSMTPEESIRNFAMLMIDDFRDSWRDARSLYEVCRDTPEEVA